MVGPAHCADLLLLLSQDEFEQLADVPDFAAIAALTSVLGLRGVVPTVEGDGCVRGKRTHRSRLHLALAEAGAVPSLDFTSRFFAPAIGVTEDPVTGSAHALLVCFWRARKGLPLGARLLGYQASARGGLVRVCETDGIVQVEGEATTVIRAELLA
mmetsp:Transcript_22036/g.54886  ORF Transcript_22036/g.54886 Transcript_22036/m.54886 type:complete len:156 (+) Transcript_22036:321-788(+)